MNIIAAVDQNWGIGFGGKLLISIPDDMKFFREKTQNKVVVMGRKTLQSLPGGIPLKNRINMVLTKSNLQNLKGAIVCESLGSLFKQFKNYDSNDIFIIGGEQIYNLLLPFCKYAYITKIGKAYFADKFLPNLDLLNNWKIIKQSQPMVYNGVGYSFFTYVNNEI